MNQPGAMPFIRIARDGFQAFTSTRQGGFSPQPYFSLNLGLHVGDDRALAIKNRDFLLTARGVEPDSVACLEQVHGCELIQAGPAHRGAGMRDYLTSLRGVDGAYTCEMGLAIAIGHADCLACVVVDHRRKAFGMAHAGWRGALGGILPKLVRSMRAVFQCRPEDLWAGLSPNLHACCLRLGAEQYQQFSQAWPDTQVYARQVNDKGFHLSLNDLARFQLRQEGIMEERVETQPFCTGCNPALFFSHRRDKGRTGRMWTVASFGHEPGRA
jgi:hypothetical protein